MLEPCTYDKIKLLHELCSIVRFIEKHAKNDAKNSGQLECYELFEKLAQDLEKHIEHLEHLTCHSSQ